jgi:hypothetical protein
MNFPHHSGLSSTRKKYSDTYLEDTARVISTLCKLENCGWHNKAIRQLLGGFQHCIEREEGYQYGLSEGFMENVELATGTRYNPNSKAFRVEHAVPLICIIKHIRDTEFDTIDSLVSFLKDEFSIYLITLEEDLLLSDAGLGMKQPEGSTVFDMTARYDAVGIKTFRKPGIVINS